MRRLNFTIALGLVAALVGAVLVLTYGSNVEERIADGKKTIPVLVATGPIEAGATVESLADLTELRDIPTAYVAKGALNDLDALAGLVTAGPLSEESQLTATMFVAPQSLALLEPSKGNVAVAVQVGLSPGVARYLASGSFVDVFATYETVSGGFVGTGVNATNRTKLFLTGVKVLSVTIAAPQTTTSDEDGAATSAAPVNEVVAVLEVSPEDAERLVNASTLGSLYLALSNEGETHSTPEGVTPDDVVGSNTKKGN